jgi:nucleoside-diphosphate-sugar epimerase
VQAAAAGKVYLAADPETLSLPELIRILAKALGLKARLLPIPPVVLSAVGVLTGQRRQIERLTHSLLVDASLARRELAWPNTTPLADELTQMARSAGR